MPSAYTQLAAAVRSAAEGVVEYETDNPIILVRLLRLKALGQGSVEIGERIPAVRDNRDEWEKQKAKP